MINKQQTKFKTQHFAIDWWLILILCGLTAISFIALFGSKAMYYNNGLNLRWDKNEVKQFTWIGVSVGVILITIYLGNDFFRKYSRLLYVGSTFLLFYILIARYIPGLKTTVPEINGAYRWIILPGIQLQPSEFVKIFLVFSVAKIAADFIEKSFSPSAKVYRKLILHMFIVSAIPILLIFLQPDTGIPTVMAISIFTILLASGVPWRYIFAIVFSLIAVLLFIYVIYHIPFTRALIDANPLVSYRFSRLEVFFLGGSDISSSTAGFQTSASLTNIGSAGLFGHGFQNSIYYTPESQTDFIFTIIASDFGFIGSLVTMTLSLLLDVRIYRILRKSVNPFDVYVGAGFLIILIFQQFFNIGMALGLLPVKGMTLPFISYGGTSLLSYAFVIGFIMNIHSRNVLSAQKSTIVFEDDSLQKELLRNIPTYNEKVPDDLILPSLTEEEPPLEFKQTNVERTRFIQ